MTKALLCSPVPDRCIANPRDCFRMRKRGAVLELAWAAGVVLDATAVRVLAFAFAQGRVRAVALREAGLEISLALAALASAFKTEAVRARKAASIAAPTGLAAGLVETAAGAGSTRADEPTVAGSRDAYAASLPAITTGGDALHLYLRADEVGSVAGVARLATDRVRSPQPQVLAGVLQSRPGPLQAFCGGWQHF